MTSLDSRLPQAPLRLLDQVRERIRYLHYSLRIEQACVHWVRAYVRFHGLRHPKEMGQAEVEAFLSWLSAERRVSVSTHRQALSALLFLYQQVFGLAMPWMSAIGRRQHDRQAWLAHRPANGAHPGHGLAEHLLVQKQQGRQRLPMGGHRHPPLCREPTQERLDLGLPHLFGMPQAMEPDVCSNPMDVGLLGP